MFIRFTYGMFLNEVIHPAINFRQHFVPTMPRLMECFFGKMGAASFQSCDDVINSQNICLWKLDID